MGGPWDRTTSQLEGAVAPDRKFCSQPPFLLLVCLAVLGNGFRGSRPGAGRPGIHFLLSVSHSLTILVTVFGRNRHERAPYKKNETFNPK